MKKHSLLFALSLLLLLSSLTRADDVKEFDLGNGITVQIEEARFLPAEHEIKNCKDSDMPCTIDGSFPFGAAFDMPHSYLKRLSLSISGKSYDLDTAGMYNAWGNRPLEYKGTVKYLGAHCYDENNCALRGLFSDAAGSFVGEWLIVNGMAKRTVISSSEDIVHLFMNNIEPPYFE
ncbi:MAG: hypothetical protein R3F42_03410 [Pseudomonadota bacterium]